MLVYRVENEVGEGAYSANLFYSTPEVYDYDAHPCPDQDVVLFPKWIKLGTLRTSYYFGFNSLDSLVRWFSYEPDRFHMAEYYGGRISVFEVPKVHVRTGQKQCIFRADKAELVRRLCLVTLEEK